MSKRVMCICGHPRAEHYGAGLHYVKTPGECYHEIMSPDPAHVCACKQFQRGEEAEVTSTSSPERELTHLQAWLEHARTCPTCQAVVRKDDERGGETRLEALCQRGKFLLREPRPMFGRDRKRLIEGLEITGAKLCHYSMGDPDEWFDGRCDCKYGGLGHGGEQTGCPEIRLAINFLLAITDDEFALLSRRAQSESSEAVLAESPGLPPKDAEVIAAFFGESVEKVQTVARLSQMKEPKP